MVFILNAFDIFVLQTFIRKYSAGYPDDMQFIKDRVMLTLKLFDKIDPEKVGIFWQ